MKTHWSSSPTLLELASDEAHVWAVSLCADRPAADKLWTTLTSDERKRADEFRFAEPRRRFVIARGALRQLLGGYLGAAPTAVEISLDANGKPQLTGEHVASGLHFNVSHSGDLALIAVAKGSEVGVDVEQLREVGHMEQIARRFFHPAESAAVLATPVATRTLAFLRCWTGKEAVLKALGTGITGSLAGFQVPMDEEWQGWVELPAKLPARERSRCWLQQIAPGGGYVAAIACVESERRIRKYTFSL